MRPQPFQPIATIGLLALCVFVFVLEVMTSPPPWNRAVNDISLDALVKLGGNAYELVFNQGQWWRMLTAMLLHGNIAHIVFNGFALWNIGSALEHRAGPSALLSTFVICGLVASVVSNLFVARDAISVGASGAIFGLFGFLVTHGVRTFAQWVQQIRLNFVQLAIMIGISALIPNVDNSAHVGGLLAGLGLGLLASRTSKGTQSLLTSGAVLALGYAAWTIFSASR